MHVFNSVFNFIIIVFQISRVPFEGNLLEALENSMSWNVKQYLNGSLVHEYLEKELKDCLMNFCELHLPSNTDIIERKEFYARLKATMRVRFPARSNSFVSIILI